MAKLLRTQLFPSTQELAGAGVENSEVKKGLHVVKKWADKFTQFMDEVFKKIASIPFNNSETIEIADTGNADTEFTVTHHLNRVPIGFMVVYADKAASVYDSGTAWTVGGVYLKCNAANTNIKVVVF